MLVSEYIYPLPKINEYNKQNVGILTIYNKENNFLMY